MVIKNGLVLGGDFKFNKTDISFGRNITAIGENLSGEAFDATDCYVIPGLVDTHFHAAMGETFIDFNEDTAKIISEFEVKNGTTSLVPAISAAPEKKMTKAVKYILSKMKDYPAIRGIHLEGPFFSVKYKGAHLPENIRIPTVDEAKRLIDAGEGAVRIITMAPELENGFETVKYISQRGVTVSVGHSDATFEQAKEAFACGAEQTTHTFNAMSPFNHRAPGLAGAAMSCDVKCELICDFFHVHKEVVNFMFKIKGADRINMITDSEVGTGMADGTYEVNGRTLTVKDKKTYTEDGTIAGGTSVLLDGVKNVVSLGVPLEEAVKTATINPATTAKIDHIVGSLEVGKLADIVVVDHNLEIKAVFSQGERVG